jgi:uncharacterized protein YkwD
MNHPRICLSRCRAILPSLLLTACAGVGASQGGGGTPAASVAGGKFAPAAAGAANYGADPSRKCASNRITDSVRDAAADAASKARKPAPRPEGRLCAMAESLIGWDDQQPVPESVLPFLAQHFGIVQSVPRVTVRQLPAMSEQDAADRIAEVMADYVGTASNVQYGLAVNTIRQGPSDRGARAAGIVQPQASKIALVMQDATLELDPLPRKLDPSGEATVKGKVLGALQNPKVLISDTRGKLQQPPEQKGKDLSAPLSCGGRTGRMVVEIRAEEQGSTRVVAAFPVLCGIDPATSLQLPAAGRQDAGQQEHAIFDQINAERTAAGLPALAWDDRVAQVARSVSQNEAQTSAKGGGAATTEQDLKDRLKQAGVTSAFLLQNPGEARTAQAVHDRFTVSPVHRANYMSTEATHGAVGVAVFTLQDGPAATVNELFVRQLAPVDVAQVRTKLRGAIDKNRASAGAPELRDDPTLEKVAEEYAKELAASGGKISNARHSQLVTPLYRSFRTVDLLSGAKGDPMELADEKTVLTTKEKLIGLGLAQGNHPTLGQNVVFAVLVFGTKK